MNDNQTATYIFTQAVCALIELEAMLAENQSREYRNEAIAYPFDEILKLQEKYGIGHNNVMALFLEAVK